MFKLWSSLGRLSGGSWSLQVSRFQPGTWKLRDPQPHFRDACAASFPHGRPNQFIIPLGAVLDICLSSICLSGASEKLRGNLTGGTGCEDPGGTLGPGLFFSVFDYFSMNHSRQRYSENECFCRGIVCVRPLSWMAIMGAVVTTWTEMGR